MIKLSLSLAVAMLFIYSAFGQIRITEIMYNPPEPGIDTLEYIELQNIGGSPINMDGYSFSSGPTFTFPSILLQSQEYLVICRNTAYYQNVFGSMAVLEWSSGALSNTGMAITIADQVGATVTSVTYTNAGPWPGGLANGNGASIVFCEVTGDNNNPDLWKAASTKTGIFHYGVELLANPFSASNCLAANEKGLLLTGVFDAQPSNAGAKGVEIFVLKDIADLSIYGIGSANNGGGSDGIEFQFPAISATSGQFIYIAEDSTLFQGFFGFSADFISDAVNINGDDAIELFESGDVIDIFGDINVDGTGEPWEYLDGWAYRIDGTGPDESTFVLSNWYFSGVGGLIGSPLNQNAPIPFPVKTYKPGIPGVLNANDDNVTLAMNTIGQFAIQANDIKPDPIITFEIVELPLHGLAAIAGDELFFQPVQDYCGPDVLTYRICDQNGCDTAAVFITISCPKQFPSYPIGQITTVNTDGVLDSVGVSCTLEGIVYGVNLRPGGLQFVMIDMQNDGITVFSNSDLGYTVKEGDHIVVQGTIAQFNGLAQIQPESINFLAGNQTLFQPTIVSQFDESIESQLIQLDLVNLVDAADWTNMTPGFNVEVTNGVDTFVMRIDNDVDIFGESPPTGSFKLKGLGTQFDSSLPFVDGYQIMPRYKSDIELISSTNNPINEGVVRLWPNPARNETILWADKSIKDVYLMNILGQQVEIQTAKSSNDAIMNIYWQDLRAGYYQLVIHTDSGLQLTKPLIIIN